MHVPAAVRQPREAVQRAAGQVHCSPRVGSNPKNGIGKVKSWAAGADRGCWPVRSFPMEASPSDGPWQVAGVVGLGAGW
jgi:hypothetical protein